MKSSQELGELAAALAAAQAEIKQPVKNAINPHYKNRYADLSAVIESALAVLPKHGLSVTQQTAWVSDGLLMLETILLHKSGQWIASDYPVIPQQATPQGYGSALTYARRYALSCALLVAADDDDDAEGATRRPARQSEPEPARQPAQPAEQPPAAAPEPQQRKPGAKFSGLQSLIDAGVCPDMHSAAGVANKLKLASLPHDDAIRLAKLYRAHRDAGADPDAAAVSAFAGDLP